MWTTADGHELGIPRSRLAPITSQMRKPEMKNLVRRNFRGNLKDAVVRSVGQLARNAHRTGNLRHRRSNRRYPVFKTRLNGRAYEIVASPVGSGRNAIVSVSAETDSELQWFAAPEPVAQIVRQSGNSIKRAAQLINEADLSQGQAVEVIRSVLESDGRKLAARVAGPNGSVYLLGRFTGPNQPVMEVTAGGKARFGHGTVSFDENIEGFRVTDFAPSELEFELEISDDVLRNTENAIREITRSPVDRHAAISAIEAAIKAIDAVIKGLERPLDQAGARRVKGMLENAKELLEDARGKYYPTAIIRALEQLRDARSAWEIL